MKTKMVVMLLAVAIVLAGCNGKGSGTTVKEDGWVDYVPGKEYATCVPASSMPSGYACYPK